MNMQLRQAKGSFLYMSGPAPFFLDLKIRFFSSDTFD
jgi:hypothetical protein